ncbi:MAG: XrtB/PEP-CTERM-associated polysaccharide biosynthesis outer membrane protein EpsL [Thiobacillaceae bacterium]
MRLLIPLVVGALQTMPVLAKEGDTFRLFASYGSTYDDNLFRLAENEGSGTPRDDFSGSLSAGLTMNWTIGRQNITANLTETQVRYQRNTSLDYDGHDYQAAWNWRLGNHLSGNLGTGESVTQSSFSNVSQINNQVLRQRHFGRVDWELHPRWRIGLGGEQADNTNGASSLSTQNFQQQSYDIGLTYITPKGSSLGFQARRVDSTFPNPQVINVFFPPFPLSLITPPSVTVKDNSYQQTEYALNGDWRFSGKLSLQGRLGWIGRSYANSQQGSFPGFTVALSTRPDFSGVSGRLSGNWSVTGKTSLSASVYQEPSDAGDINAITALNQGASINGAWLVREKWRLNTGATFVKRSFQGDPGVSQNKDNTLGVSLSLGYTPIRAVSLNVGLSSGSRDSDNTVEDYKFHSLFANVRADF